MSLVAYGSSDESSEDEGIDTSTDNKHQTTDEIVANATAKVCLSVAEDSENSQKKPEISKDATEIDDNESSDKIHFEKLPKPKTVEPVAVTEEEDEVLLKKEIERAKPEGPAKKNRGPVRITVPSLSEFKDLDDENEQKSNRIMPSKKGTGLFALLPPPKTTEVKSKTTLIPQSVVKNSTNINQAKSIKPSSTHLTPSKPVIAKSSLLTSSYDSNSEDEDDIQLKGDIHSTTDFFSLSTPDPLPDLPTSESTSTTKVDLHNINEKQGYVKGDATVHIEEQNTEGRTLMSNVMNMSKEEILLKNQAEVGPKLPIPEQEYNVDQAGNVAFDEKAIEYLCGKRGVKRKTKEFEEANIIEINGEDIKPDEREWLVKALTEEPIQRPVSMLGGVNSQSKKKHQITYLAHQAKAMEMELKNQWALNRMTRKQTQSKYGF